MAIENGPGLKMYSILKMGIFQPAMLVYQRVMFFCCPQIFKSSFVASQIEDLFRSADWRGIDAFPLKDFVRRKSTTGEVWLHLAVSRGWLDE